MINIIPGEDFLNYRESKNRQWFEEQFIKALCTRQGWVWQQDQSGGHFTRKDCAGEWDMFSRPDWLNSLDAMRPVIAKLWDSYTPQTPDVRPPLGSKARFIHELLCILSPELREIGEPAFHTARSLGVLADVKAWQQVLAYLITTGDLPCP